MKLKDVKIGMKVVPHQKSIWGSLADCNVWQSVKDTQGFLFVAQIDEDGEITLCATIEESDGNLYKCQDIVPYDDINFGLFADRIFSHLGAELSRISKEELISIMKG